MVLMNMDKISELPFEIGQEIESRSFITGFRGAWFRCKIKKVGSTVQGQKRYALEYFDFPDEKIRWTKLYQSFLSSKDKKGRQELMVRPHYPPLFRQSQMADQREIPETVVVADDDWKVGDLADWWTDGCYWLTKVSKLLGDDKVQIDLPEPPLGEGGSYEANCKDLRPTLDWSLEHGWSVPFSEAENGNERRCAHLIQPSNQGVKEQTSEENNPDEPTSEFEDSVPSDKVLRCTNPEMEACDIVNHHCLDENIDSHDKETEASCESPRTTSRSDQDTLMCPKRMRVSENERAAPDTIDSSLIDLEELVHKVKWLEGLLQFGFQWSNAMKPSWEFLEKRASFTKR